MKSNKDIKKHIANLDAAKEFFEKLRDSKQEAYDKKSERWQQSDAGLDAEAEISELDALVNSVESAAEEAGGIFEVD